MMNVSSIIQTSKSYIGKNLPTILSVASILGVVGVGASASRDSLKARDILDNMDTANMTQTQIVRAVWKCYIPTSLVVLATGASIVMTRSVDKRRIAALSAAYSMVEVAAKEYKTHVLKEFGEKGLEQIENSISSGRLEDHPLNNESVIIETGNGSTLMYDSMSGRYFKSDIEIVRKVVNDLNQQVINVGYVSLNIFYSMLGLEQIELGDELGWNTDELLEVRFDAKIAADKTPCIVLGYYTTPKYEFYKF